MDNIHDVKHTIIKTLHQAVKACQSEFVNKTEVATESNSKVSQLCKEWEVVFFHGIKRRSNKSIFSLKYNNLSEIPNSFIHQIKPFTNQNSYSFWAFICEFLESDDVIRFTNTLDKIDTDIGRCRAWLRSAINEQTLEPFLVKAVSSYGQNMARKYYEPFAILLDGEENAVLPNLAAGISSIMFALELNNEMFNNFLESNCLSQNNSTSSSVSRPRLFSSSTSGSFEDIEIIDPVVRPNNGDSGNRNNSKKKNRIINIIPIDDDDDGISDSSDLYSPFNLLKTSVLNTGLNLVSKFQFGNEEKLSNIQEQENKSQPTHSSHNSTLSNNPALINVNFREFDETEFEDCCLSLQKEFYSPSSNKSLSNHIADFTESTNKTFLSADLVVIDPISKSSSPSNICSLSSYVTSSIGPESNVPNTNEENLDYNHIQENQEFINLTNQLAALSAENDRLRNDYSALKMELEEREKRFTSDFSKLSRENDLLKKKLKTYIMKSNSTESTEEISDEFSGNSVKIEQLLQMHADILELNDQLQRSLVNKDIKIGMLQSKISNLMQHEGSSGIHFDKFGTIYLGIVDYFQRGSGSNKHFCYKIHIRCCPASSNLSNVENDEWTTCRRYKEFHRFYLEFISKNPTVKNIVFPSKWLYKPTEEQLIDRQKGLESFLHIAVAFIFQNTLSRNINEINSKPATYESFKKVSRWGRGSTESRSSLTSISFSDDYELDGNILSRHNISNIISFLAPNTDES